MIPTITAFLVMLNPFAMFLYLGPIMKELPHKDFVSVLLRASIISMGIFSIFLFAGDFLFQDIFRIDFESFRIFGGIVVFSLAYFYIVHGHKALVRMKTDLDDLASEIALPFMVGAGTISLTLVMAHEFSTVEGLGLLSVILSLNSFMILALKFVRDKIPKQKIKIAFDKNMEIFLRLTGFFLGAIGINMVITGITALVLA